MGVVTESEARAAGAVVFRSPDGRAWCLCPDCSERHASPNKRRTRHDRWAIDGQDWRIRDELASPRSGGTDGPV